MTQLFDDKVDFVAAEMFLKQAKLAFESGSQNGFIAARKMVLLALGIEDHGNAPRSK